MTTPSIIGIVLGAIVTLVIVWCGILFLFSRLGWSTLAESYATDMPAPKELLHFRTLSFGLIASYGRAANYGLTDDGLYLSLPLVLSIGHPPLFIPWSTITGTEKRWGRFEVFTFGTTEVGLVKRDAALIREKIGVRGAL